MAYRERTYSLSSSRLRLKTALKRLEDENLRVRQTAAVALGQIGPDAAPAVPQLIKTLSDPDDILRRHAAALGRIGATSPEALAALRKAARDESRIVREAAADSLERVEER